MFTNPTDKNTQKQNNNPTPSLFGNTVTGGDNKPAGGSLFGAPTGGLFGSTNTGGLFSGAASTQLKTSERKQGGLFGNLAPTKPPGSTQEAPKITFGGIGTTTPTPGGLLGSSLGGKKQQAPSSGSLFGKPASGSSLFGGNQPSGGLFGNAPTPSGGLFGSTKPAQTKPKQTPKEGLFAQSTLFSTTNSTVQQKKQEKPAGSLFGSSTGGLFGNVTPTPTPSGGLFGNQKKEGGLFGSTTPESSLFGKASQPATTPSLFGAATKKQQQQKPKQGGLFGNVATPGSSLFGKSTQGTKQPTTEAPKFSLTGNVTTPTPTFGGSSGLFVNLQNKPQQKPKTQPVKRQAQQPKPLFGGVTPTLGEKQEKKPAVSSLFGSNQGGLFNQPKAETTKGTQTGTGGLFGSKVTEKKETAPVSTPSPLTGSLFGQKKQQGGKQQEKPSGGLFGSSLFGKAPEQKTQKVESTLGISKVTEQKQTPKQASQQVLLPTFGKKEQAKPQTIAQPSLFSSNQEPAKQTNAPQKTRTISFNEAPSPKPSGETKPNETKTLSGGLFASNLNKPPAEESKKTTAQQQVKPPTGDQPIIPGFKPSSLPQTKPAQPTKPFTQQQQQPKQQEKNSFFSQVPPSTVSAAKQPLIMTSHQITQLVLNRQQLKKTQLKNIEQWITLSYTRSNTIPSNQMAAKSFALHKNEDINRFLNDLFREVVVMVNLPYEQKSFKLINKLFDQLLDKLQVKQYLFKCTTINLNPQDPSQQTPTLQLVQLNNAYFTHHNMYKFTPQGIHLNLQSLQVKKYLMALTKKFISNHIEYLQFLQRKIQLLQLPYGLFFTLLQYCLTYNKLRVKTLSSNQSYLNDIVALIEDFQKKLVTRVTTLLETFVDQNFSSFQLINKQYVLRLIKLLDTFSYTEQHTLIKTSLKTILNTLDLSSPNLQSTLNPQLKSIIKQTRSLQLLPIRTLLSCLEPNASQQLSLVSAHDLYHYVCGPQWIDWLEIYLNSGMMNNAVMERQVSALQAKYMLNVLAYPKLKRKRISREKMSPKQSRYLEQLQKKILPRKRPICKFILSLKQQNMLDIFYLILESLIYDYESYRRITETFFKQKDEFIYQFKTIVAEVCNYPVQQFKEEIPFLEEKMSYFLRVCEVAPDKIIEIERMVFDGIKMSDKKNKQELLDLNGWNVGHRICHLVIDTINYFGIRQNQSILAKAFGCLRQLLSHESTSGAMKLAMSVNKPQLSFISPLSQVPLSQRLTTEMMDLLEYFLISDEFVYMLMTNLKSNNSPEVELQKYYAMRYSVKDYKVLISSVGMGQRENKAFIEQSEKQITLDTDTYHNQHKGLTIIPSSYWLLRLLQTLVRSFRQQYMVKASIQQEKQMLFILNLILERLIMPVISAKNITNTVNKTQTLMVSETVSRPSSNPIYSLGNGEVSRVMLYMIEALNSIDIFALIRQKLCFSISKSSIQSPYTIHNNLLFQNYEQNQLTVYFTLNVLKNILSIYRHFETLKNMPIKSKNQQSLLQGKLQNENKMIYKLLVRMKWLEQVEQEVFVKSLSSANSISEINPNNYTGNDIVMGLVTLLSANIPPQSQHQPSTEISVSPESSSVNMKLSYQKPFVIPIIEGQQSRRKINNSSLNKVEKFYSLYREELNFQMVHDFLTLTEDKYLQASASMQTLVVKTLQLLVGSQQSYEYSLSLVKHLTFSFQSSMVSSSTTWLLHSLSNQLLTLLSCPQSSIQLKQSILSLLYEVIRSTEHNAGFIFAKKIFYQYVRKCLLLTASQNQKTVEDRNRVNLIIAKTMNILYDKDNANLLSILNPDFIDKLSSTIIVNCQQLLPSSSSICKQLQSFKNKYLYPKEMTYYQLQTASEERDLVVLGDVLSTVQEVIVLLEKVFFDSNIRGVQSQKKLKFTSLRRLTKILINTHLPYLPIDIWGSSLSTLALTPLTDRQSSLQIIPRTFSSNPLEYLINQATSLDCVYHCYKLYKENIVNYVSFNCLKLSQQSLRFLTWVLTVDHTLYGNQPVAVIENGQSKMSCASHMDSYQMCAVQMFGENQVQAVSRIKQLYNLSLHTLNLVCNEEKLNGYNFIQVVTVMGYCLEWLRARKDTVQVLSVLIKSTLSSSQSWLQQTTLIQQSVIKLVHSIASISQYINLSSTLLQQIKSLITQILSKYIHNKTIVSNESTIHQLLIILANLPAMIENHEIIANLTALWQTETNSHYFYSLSRLIMQYTLSCPGELARLKLLTKSAKANQLFNSQNTLQQIPCYHYGMRSPQSISITWLFKIATAMMSSSEESILLLQQVSEFYKLSQKYIENLIKTVSGSANSVSFVSMELLETVMEFLLTLVSSHGWLTVNRTQFEKITFLLTHKTINVVMDLIGGKLAISPQSEMQKRLRKQSSLSINNLSPQLDTTSPYRLFSDKYIISILNLFTRLVSYCLFNSYYIHKYFNSAVYENYRYGVSYWDRMNKTISDIIKYAQSIRRKYHKFTEGKMLSNKLLMLNDFLNSSEYFVQTGYLVSLFNFPEAPQDFITNIDQLIANVLQLGNLHLIQQSTFRQRYQCLMKGNIQKFGNKLIDNTKMLHKIHDQNQKNNSSINHQTNYAKYYQLMTKNLLSILKNV